jgi:hypothetical protein
MFHMVMPPQVAEWELLSRQSFLPDPHPEISLSSELNQIAWGWLQQLRQTGLGTTPGGKKDALYEKIISSKQWVVSQNTKNQLMCRLLGAEGALSCLTETEAELETKKAELAEQKRKLLSQLDKASEVARGAIQALMTRLKVEFGEQDYQIPPILRKTLNDTREHLKKVYMDKDANQLQTTYDALGFHDSEERGRACKHFYEQILTGNNRLMVMEILSVQTSLDDIRYTIEVYDQLKKRQEELIHIEKEIEKTKQRIQQYHQAMQARAMGIRKLPSALAEFEWAFKLFLIHEFVY